MKSDPVECFCFFFQRTISRTTKTTLQCEGCLNGPCNVEFPKPNISCFSSHLSAKGVFLGLLTILVSLLERYLFQISRLCRGYFLITVSFHDLSTISVNTARVCDSLLDFVEILSKEMHF